jgi:hypothetical protein
MDMENIIDDLKPEPEANMSTRYSLAELMKDPHRPLTSDQWNNFDRYMLMENEGRPASDVDITPGVDRAVAEINEKGTYWW